MSRHPVYNVIGEGYSSHRRTDPAVFSRILSALAPCGTVVNVGAGTGSYEPPTCKLAIEPSLTMIMQRQSGSAPCVQAVAEQLPLPDKSFDGSLACLTIHHWSNLAAGLGELRRVTKKRIVLVTWDPEFDGTFWLTRDYLPEILEFDRKRFPSVAELANVLGKVGVQPLPVPHDCQDGFFGANWKRPAAYLDPLIRRTNSATAQLDPEIVSRGIGRLRDDLQTGKWASRNSELADKTSLDLGYRLVVSDQS